MLSIHFLLFASIPSFILNPLISLVIPAVAGTISAALYQWIKKGSEWVDGLTGQTHVLVIGAISIVLPQLGKLVPGMPSDIAGFDAATVQSLVVLALTQLTHLLLTKPAAPVAALVPSAALRVAPAKA